MEKIKERNKDKKDMWKRGLYKNEYTIIEYAMDNEMKVFSI